MKELNLQRVWELCNILSEKQSELCEEGYYIYLLGNYSNYCNPSFEGFLNYYSFRIDGDDIVVFNDDKVAWEDYTTNDFSTFPSVLLSFSPEKLESWIETEIELELAKQERQKLENKKRIQQQIETLQKQLIGL